MMRLGLLRFAIGRRPGSFGPGLMMRLGLLRLAIGRRPGRLLMGPLVLPAGMAGGVPLRDLMPGDRFMIGLLWRDSFFFLSFEQG